MDILRRIPLVGYVIIVVIGGVLFYLWWKHNMGASTNASSTSSVPGANQGINPLNPYNDPNIDPNTGVPFQIEEATNAQGVPYYYASQGQPGTPSAPPTPTPTGPNPATVAARHATLVDLARGLGITYDQLIAALQRESTATHVPFRSLVSQVQGGTVDVTTLRKYLNPGGPQPHNPKDPTGPATRPTGGGSAHFSARSFVFRPFAETGQTPHLSHVAIQEYGVTSASDIDNVTSAIIRANPGLRGQSYSYQPPAGTQIVLP